MLFLDKIFKQKLTNFEIKVIIKSFWKLLFRNIGKAQRNKQFKLNLEWTAEFSIALKQISNKPYFPDTANFFKFEAPLDQPSMKLIQKPLTKFFKFRDKN